MGSKKLSSSEKEKLAFALAVYYFDEYNIHQMNSTRTSHICQKRRKAWEEINQHVAASFPTMKLPNDLQQWFKKYISDTKAKLQFSQRSGAAAVSFTEAEKVIIDRIGRHSIIFRGLEVGELGVDGFEEVADETEVNTTVNEVILDSMNNVVIVEDNIENREISSTPTGDHSFDLDASDEWGSPSQLSRAGKKKEEGIDKLTRQAREMSEFHHTLLETILQKRKSEDEVDVEIKKAKLESQKMTVEATKSQIELQNSQRDLAKLQAELVARQLELVQKQLNQNEGN